MYGKRVDQDLADVYALLQSQAAVLSYAGAYWLLSTCSALMFFGSFLLKKNEPGKGGKVSVHWDSWCSIVLPTKIFILHIQ